ncbi:MAG: four helix bundle protein [Verrucomicrobia bacterium]|nr:four helix bundle protein [Verrucomicrobiota bacterium]
MTLARHFRDLDVYQNSLILSVDIHHFCEGLPTPERYALADQMRRASRSVASNIAEAWRKRRYKAAFISKLSDSETEAGEMQCWLDVALKLNYLGDAEYRAFDDRFEHIIAQITLMIGNADKWCTNDKR